MKILLVSPDFPETFWSFKHALKLISKKASLPPLGLLTVAAMLPGEWEKKLVDMNVTSLKDEDITWADYVFISAMAIQQQSARRVIERCQQLGAKTVAGGPLFTTSYEEFEEVDHLVIGEAEATLPLFLRDVGSGSAQHLYVAHEWPDISKTPVPLWEIADMKKYSSMSVQNSRGCPFDCEFCDIVVLNGRRPRVKEPGQFLRELDALYRLGWREGVFVVDDNFIGNKVKLKTGTLPALIQWMQAHDYPFSFFTEASLNLADDDELMELMVEAGFDKVFIGIETPNEESLTECSKLQNTNRNLEAAVKRILNHGLQVQGGFIVGFDHDPPSIFESQINFIQRSGIVTAMVSLLCAPKGTRLYQRLKKEKRLLGETSGDNDSINFIPKMNWETLFDGYGRILSTIYSPKQFYERVRMFLNEYRPRYPKTRLSRLRLHHLKALFKSLWLLGVRERGKIHYWKLLLWTLLFRPRSMPTALSLAANGLHLQRFTRSYVARLSYRMGSKPLARGEGTV